MDTMAAAALPDKTCTHYERHCNLVCPSCSEAAPCRLCHADTASHELDRFAVTTLECRQCGLRQPKAKECSQCGVCFGKYACLECCLFDDVDHGQFHCSGCRLCRVGGADNFRHCDQCGYCMTPQHYDGHQCLPGASSRPCPVCLEDIHSSRVPPQVLKCRHLVHSACYHDMVKGGISACPVCGKTMFDMTKEWKRLDRMVREMPMPACYRGVCCQVLCKDCNKECITLFHVEALKCKLCGSYNTTRSGGSLLRKKTGTDTSASSNNPVEQESAGEAMASQSTSGAATTSSQPVDYTRTIERANRAASSVLSAAINLLTATTRPTPASPSPSDQPQAPPAVAAPSPDLASPLVAEQAMDTSEPSSPAAAQAMDSPAPTAPAAAQVVDSPAPSSRGAAQAMDSPAPSGRGAAQAMDSPAPFGRGAAQAMDSPAPSGRGAASLHSALDESWVSVDDNAPEPLTAKEEAHLYETVDVTELEESEPPADGSEGLALLDGLLQQLHADSIDDTFDDINGGFSSMAASSDEESEPPEVLSVEIDGRVARLEEAEASDWETDDGEEEHQSGAEDQFQSAESD